MYVPNLDWRGRGAVGQEPTTRANPPGICPVKTGPVRHSASVFAAYLRFLRIAFGPFPTGCAMPSKNQNEPRLHLSKKEVARRYAVSTRTINNWVVSGSLPAPMRWTRQTVRWSLQVLEQRDKDLSR